MIRRDQGWSFRSFPAIDCGTKPKSVVQAKKSKADQEPVVPETCLHDVIPGLYCVMLQQLQKTRYSHHHHHHHHHHYHYHHHHLPISPCTSNPFKLPPIKVQIFEHCVVTTEMIRPLQVLLFHSL